MARSERLRLSTAAVVDAAIGIVDDRGVDALTLAAVAEKTGVAAPSLYKHVASLAELKALVGVRVMEELTQRLTAATVGRSRDDAVTALMHTFRAYVTQYPGRYAAMPPDPLRNPALAAAGAQLLNVFLAVMRGYGIDKPTAIHRIRCMRAIAHGFASIEAAGGFGLPEDLDDTYEQLIGMFIASLPRS